jgi:NADPH-dependent 2,4-dienoyl-CoA reductase/sulfur reductase-like enzyme
MRFVVVGLHAAGRSACGWLRRLSPQAEIIGVDPDPTPPYARPLISYALSGEIEPGLLYLKETNFFQDLGVVLEKERAARLDPHRQVLTLESGREISYHKLLIATGASPRRVEVEGARASEVLYFRDRADLGRIQARIRPGGVAAVLGGGLVGYKLTLGLLAQGMSVKLIVTSPRPLSLNVDEYVGEAVARKLSNHPRVELFTKASLTAMEPGRDKAYALTLDNGKVFEADLVAAGKGVVPDTAWLEDAGLCGEQCVPVDSNLMTKAPGVYAAGDAASVWDLVHQAPQTNAIWPMAVEQGRFAAWNMAYGPTVYPGAMAMNSIPTQEGFMISVGVVNPRYTAGCDFLTVEPKKGSYLKLVFRQGRLIGAVGLNAAPRLGELVWAVRQGLTRDKVPRTWLNNLMGAAPLAGSALSYVRSPQP